MRSRWRVGAGVEDLLWVSGSVASCVASEGSGRPGTEATSEPSGSASTDDRATDSTHDAGTTGDTGTTAAPDPGETSTTGGTTGCGDGARSSDEACDGPLGPDLDCRAFGFGRGTPRCTEDCAWDLSGCADPFVGWMFGGKGQEPSTCLDDVWIFGNDQWGPLGAAGPEARSYAQWAFTADGLVAFGGQCSTTTFPGTWRLAGRTWTRLDAGAEPPPRTQHALVAFGGGVLVFGGATASPFAYLDDTWLFDGARWTEIDSPRGPSARGDALLVSVRNDAILHGGWDGTTHTDTWRFEGSVWTEVVTADAPPGRIEAAAAGLGDDVILYSGSVVDGGAFVPRIDTWRFDGADWSELSPTDTPPPHAGHRMATVAGSVVLFGGHGTDTLDTWAFDGRTWRRAAGDLGPLARFRPALTAGPR